MSLNRSLISPTSNPVLERALIEKLQRRCEAAGSLGELEPVSVRLGLMQNTLKPRFRDPQLVVFAADHGLAVEGIQAPQALQTHELVRQLLTGRLPVSVFARIQGLETTVVDCGLANPVAPHERLMARKIAHGTRNARVGPAMALEQAHAAIRAGMEIGDGLRGNMVACAGVGVGSHEAAALVLSRLTQSPLRDLLISGPQMDPDMLARMMVVLLSAHGRHRDIIDPVETLAAFGGFETAVMVGVMLVAASKRHLIMVDGMAACAAMMVASQIAAAVTDYCVFCRSQTHRGLDQAFNLFSASALLELGMDSIDGTGACVSWPLVRSAAALLAEVADGDDPGPSQPHSLGDSGMGSLSGFHPTGHGRQTTLY
ncbi:nicotinate-nucleotide--dimethylbenzimidazole phosphoribosyltransferase [Ideonella sp. A 288]|uniref:nicotinate-nucleotide--dimethylbenzimidazole phosphoribosyltransferase n=1 Tax=Ideonella sp. A 288 TaxID=1962181 RepID=UPI000B4BD531|nr:nicotinate-nucleotide--dimethylbenzimidazole phosphoribosyltransferase [Ideonella sp. A 288]